MKKIFSIFVVFFLFISCFAPAFAAEVDSSEDSFVLPFDTIDGSDISSFDFVLVIANDYNSDNLVDYYTVVSVGSLSYVDSFCGDGYSGISINSNESSLTLYDYNLDGTWVSEESFVSIENITIKLSSLRSVVYCTHNLRCDCGESLFYDPSALEPSYSPPSSGDDGIIGFIRTFFSELFKPITYVIQVIFDLLGHLTVIGELWDYLKGYTLDPIIEFFDSFDLGLINLLAQIWSFPIISDFLIAFVAIAVFGGIMMLFSSL